jgi:hypothetical protein
MPPGSPLDRDSARRSMLDARDQASSSMTRTSICFSRTYSTVAAISGKKLSNLASIDVGVQMAISHFSRNRLFSPGFCPAELLKSTEMAGHCQGRTVKRKSSVRYCRLSHVPFCRSKYMWRFAMLCHVWVRSCWPPSLLTNGCGAAIPGWPLPGPVTASAPPRVSGARTGPPRPRGRPSPSTARTAPRQTCLHRCGHPPSP